MPVPFSPATAEQAIAAVEAVVINGKPADINFVANFSDLPSEQAEAALKLAADLGFLSVSADRFSVASPLSHLVVTANQMQKAAVLRVVLEVYRPFVVFRERLVATNLAQTAAQQTQAVLDLAAHREEIKDTLVSLGTYSHALVTEGGGRYRPGEEAFENPLEALAATCRDAASAEARVREQLGADASAIVSRDEVIIPLAEALIRAKSGDPLGASVAAGNAVESYLDGLASRVSVETAGATGINGKLDRFDQTGKLPKKLVSVGKYLGHIRNAADHGIDSQVGASWTIRKATGTEYIFVACSFIASATAREKGRPPEI